ncbi:MAG: O-antigen ligase family protein, partial [Elusimicrobia bacterium]|nr:O-antigen ligase family protein [Elusimicrobiota bacterium]
LYSSGTKGAWLGFAVGLSLFISVYTYFFLREQFQKIKHWILGIALVIPLASLGLVLSYIHRTDPGRMTSVRFRLQTWLATWEMIQTQPLIGTGVGSFKVIYPAFRRPTIFIIEGKHNTETDHAEDEYLEQWFDNGIIGFGIFLWLIVSTSLAGFRALNQLTSQLVQKGGRPPPRAYDILGYLVAFLAMLAHNCFDVSMRFVSSGVYFGLLPGLVLNLSRGQGLRFLSERSPAVLPQAVSEKPWLSYGLALLKVGAWIGLAYLGSLLCREFHFLQGPLSRVVHGGETLQWWISWIVFLCLVFGLVFAFGYLIYQSRNVWVPCLALAMLGPMYIFWGYFKADVHHNMAIFFSRQAKWNEALENYLKVNRFNPYFIMAYYFKGNVFNDRFNMTKQFKPEWGDKAGEARDDFERALSAYEEVRSLAPNYVQMHHQVGVMYMKRADYAMREGKNQEAAFYLDKALERFRMYRNLDPIFGLNYYRMAQIHLMRQEFDKAIELYDQHIQSVVDHVGPYNRNPDLCETYTQKGNAYLVRKDVTRAEQTYRKALETIPNCSGALKGLETLKGP